MSFTNGSSAPVCPVSRSQTPPGMPGILYAAVPKVTDLPSAIAAANAIAGVLRQLLANQRPGVNNVYPQNMPISDGSGGSALETPRWVETGRTVSRMKFVNPDDSNISVTVDRIVNITWHDTVYDSDMTFAWSPERAAEIIR